MFLATLSVQAEEAPPPLIDIDGTIALQFVLFLLMLGVLSRLLFRPYLKMRDARERGIDGARTEAKEMAASARTIVAEYDEKLGRARVRGADERHRLRTEGVAKERSLLGAARDESQRAVEEARSRISAETDGARLALQGEAEALARQMAAKIIGREVS